MNIAFANSNTLLSREQLLQLIEAELKQFFYQANPCEPLASALHYSVFPGGKRIRPVLALLLFQDLAQDPKKLLRASLSLEVFHCATLIHDDMPALDNDDFRRGKASSHKVFGEATALLAGDYLSALTFKCLSYSELDAQIQSKLMGLMAQSCMEVCEGQQLDLLLADGFSDFSRIHRLKTASLFRAAAGFAAYASELKTEQAQELLMFGTWLGLGFQLLNDLIDAFGSEQERGRPISSDKKNHKATLAGFDAAHRAVLIESVEKGATACLDRVSTLSITGFSGVRELLTEIVLQSRTVRS